MKPYVPVVVEFINLKPGALGAFHLKIPELGHHFGIHIRGAGQSFGPLILGGVPT
jgi:hypothetical protein